MPYDEKSKERTMRYLDKLKEIRFRVKTEEYELYQKSAKEQGYKSMRQFYIDAINRKIKEMEDKK